MLCQKWCLVASLPSARSCDLDPWNCLCKFQELRSHDFSPRFARMAPYIRVYLPFLFPQSLSYTQED